MVSDALIARTKRHEGYRALPYLDTTGNLTIGYGHRINDIDLSDYATGVSKAQAEKWLLDDLEHAEYSCEKTLSWFHILNDTRQEALIEMVFQLGMGGLLGFKKMLMCASAEDYSGAAMHGEDSLWRKQSPARCKELMDNMRRGIDTYDAVS